MYDVDLAPGAAHDLERLNAMEREDVDDVLAALAQDPFREGTYALNLPLPTRQCTIRGALRVTFVVLVRSRQLVVTDVERLSRW